MVSNDRRRFLQLSAGAGSLALLPESIRRALSIAPARAAGSIQDVQHVVVLMQENRSFDHYFGTLRGVRGFGDRHPVPLPDGSPVWRQQDRDGRVVTPFHLDTRSTSAVKVDDLPHGWADAQAACNQGRWDQWVPAKTALTMGHYRREDLAFQFALAEAFTLCDAYHCSIHGSTSPNRIALMSGSIDPTGTGGGPVIGNDRSANIQEYTQPLVDPLTAAKLAAKFGPLPEDYGRGPRVTFSTYPERLEQAGISWKVYQEPMNILGGLNNALVSFRQYWDSPRDGALWRKGMSLWTLDDLKRDVMEGTLPQVSWIVPNGPGCEHPASSSPVEGASYIQAVLDALTADPKVWARTVLFVTFDENDGFFDHMPSPAPPAPRPDGGMAGLATLDVADEIHPTEKRPYGLGPRVPMYVVSPWSRGGWVNSQVFDHTSVLRFLELRFGVREPTISAWRRSVCGDLTTCFDFTRRDGAAAALPSIGDAAAIVSAAEKLPAPAAPPDPAALFQERGTRPSRALPYRLEVTATRSGAGIHLAFVNSGRAGAVFHVYDHRRLGEMPRRYTVEAGKSLADHWPVGDGGYELSLFGPAGFLRVFAGSAGSALETAVTQEPGGQVRLTARNEGDRPAALRIAANAHRADGPWTLNVPAGGTAEQRWQLADSGHWYDFTAMADGLMRRFAGRVETGRHSISDPAMGA